MDLVKTLFKSIVVGVGVTSGTVAIITGVLALVVDKPPNQVIQTFYQGIEVVVESGESFNICGQLDCELLEQALAKYITGN